jgi:hypothetical protein
MPKQEEMPHRLRFIRISEMPNDNWFVYEGFLSLAPNPVDCYRGDDSPLEFFMNINKFNGDVEVKVKPL